MDQNGSTRSTNYLNLKVTTVTVALAGQEKKKFF